MTLGPPSDDVVHVNLVDLSATGAGTRRAIVGVFLPPPARASAARTPGSRPPPRRGNAALPPDGAGTGTEPPGGRGRRTIQSPTDGRPGEASAAATRAAGCLPMRSSTRAAIHASTARRPRALSGRVEVAAARVARGGSRRVRRIGADDDEEEELRGGLGERVAARDRRRMRRDPRTGDAGAVQGREMADGRGGGAPTRRRAAAYAASDRRGQRRCRRPSRRGERRAAWPRRGAVR